MLDRFKVPSADQVRVSEAELRRIVTAIFERMNLTPEDAALGADVLVTTDLLGLPRNITSEISEYANKSYGLRRDQILFNSSHTHTGPVVKSSLAGAYDLDAAQSALIDEYTRRLKNGLLKVIGEAIKDLSPARLSFGRGAAPFAMNRRQFNPNGVVIGGMIPIRSISVPSHHVSMFGRLLCGLRGRGGAPSSAVATHRRDSAGSITSSTSK